jgi:hypothetical protein
MGNLITSWMILWVINGQSVREEAERIKAEFDSISQTKKLMLKVKFYSKAC